MQFYFKFNILLEYYELTSVQLNKGIGNNFVYNFNVNVV